MEITQQEILILFAAMLAMVHDIHAAQDNLSEEQWLLAEQLYQRLEQEVNPTESTIE